MHYRFQKLALLWSLAIPLLAQAPTPKLMIDARELADYSVIARRIKDFEHLPCKTNATEYNAHAINISDFVRQGKQDFRPPYRAEGETLYKRRADCVTHQSLARPISIGLLLYTMGRSHLLVC